MCTTLILHIPWCDFYLSANEPEYLEFPADTQMYLSMAMATTVQIDPLKQENQKLYIQQDNRMITKTHSLIKAKHSILSSVLLNVQDIFGPLHTFMKALQNCLYKLLCSIRPKLESSRKFADNIIQNIRRLHNNFIIILGTLFSNEFDKYSTQLHFHETDMIPFFSKWLC